MKANELSCKDLMVGDWVKPKNADVSFKVGLIGVDSVWNDTDTHEWDYDELEPIPLTPEILEKNGLGRDSHGRLLCEYFDEDINQDLEITVDSKTGGVWWSYNREEYYIIKLRYVHQLQHALRLCGIEKEIVL